MNFIALLMKYWEPIFWISVIGVFIISFFLIRYEITSLRSQNAELQTQNAQLQSNAIAQKTALDALNQRIQENQKITVKYEQLQKKLKNLKDGPVSDVLHYAIDHDSVQSFSGP